MPEDAYPDGLTVLAPIETWSDDFSMAIAGIPSTVNDFSAGPFMETHYHSQYDNEEIYQENVYRFHHELYTRLLLKLDTLIFPPLDFPICSGKCTVLSLQGWQNRMKKICRE